MFAGSDLSGCRLSPDVHSRKSCSPVPSQITPPRLNTPPSCLQFTSSCAMKSPPTLPQYYPASIPAAILPYRDWHQPQRQTHFPYNRFAPYEQTKPAQITSFLPPSPEKPYKDYSQIVQDTNLAEWYVCQNTAGSESQASNVGQQQTEQGGTLPLPPALHQQVLTAGY